MNIEPLSTYIPYGDYVSMNRNDWSMYKACAITDLPEDQVEKVVNVLTDTTVKEGIGSTKFNNIFILVHFPHVRVTNEHDRFVDINHLWAKVKVMYNGTLNGGFTLNRSEYTMLHISSRYMHSHISSIPTNDFTQFQNPCTGSGPINGTISVLNRDYDEDMWNMFCLELSKYVVLISNEFIKWYNDQFNKGKLNARFTELKRRGILKECIIDNGKIYYDGGRNNVNNYAQYIGKKVCVFKGKEITVNITDIAEVRNENKSIILDTQAALYILTTILKVLNYRYGRSKATHEDNQLGTEVRYL